MSVDLLERQGTLWKLASSGRWIRVGLPLAVVVLWIGSLYALSLRSATNPDQSSSLRQCVEFYRGVLPSQNPDVMGLGRILTYCFSEANYQGQVGDIEVSHANFVNQRFETNILLWMVVSITISGVLLAGLQLLGSYKLASLGHSKFSEEANIAYGKGGVVVKSSIIGVGILAISFAFFLIYVVDVYKLNPIPGVSTQAPAALTVTSPRK